MLLLVGCVLAACGSQEVDSNCPWNGIQHNESGTCIFLDMTYDEVKAALPDMEHLSTVGANSTYLYGGDDLSEDKLTIHFHEKTVTEMAVVGTLASNWSLHKEITIGSTKEEIVAAYGEPARPSDELLEYYYDADGDLIGAEKGDPTYAILLVLEENELNDFYVRYYHPKPAYSSE